MQTRQIIPPAAHIGDFGLDPERIEATNPSSESLWFRPRRSARRAVARTPLGEIPENGQPVVPPRAVLEQAALASARVAHDSPVDALRHHRTRRTGSAPDGWIHGIAARRASPARVIAWSCQCNRWV